MSITLYLYGDLKKEIERKEYNPGIPTKLHLKKEENIDTIHDILEKIKLNPNKVSHIFVNGKYCGLGKKVKGSERIGLFPRNMALNFAEIEKNNPIRVYIKLSENLKFKKKLSEFKTRIPEGSTLKYLLKKINLTPDLKELKVIKNDTQVDSLNTIIQEGDKLQISILE
jgi:sulfur carrier protein ThiS